MNLAEFIIRVESYNANVNIPLLRRAFEFSLKAHEGQTRESGEPFVSHLLGVALILAEWHLDSETIAAGLLHDVVEDTQLKIENLEKEFGEEIAHLVDGVTKISLVNYESREEQQVEFFRKMLLSMARDIRIILIKLADRLHNMNTLEHLPREKQIRIAQETRDIYAPLANRLGIAKAKVILEDLSFKYLEPERFQDLARRIDTTRAEREAHVSEVVSPIREALANEKIEAEVTGRAKNLDSINRKILVRGVPFEKIYDLSAIRVIVRLEHECYHVLGVVHSIWKPAPDRFHDYIANPKPNGYQSLHTTVIGPRGKMVEIQIRTREMHYVAENGVASHWLYKEGKRQFDKADRQMVWLRDVLEWQKDAENPGEFMELLKRELFAEDIYVFTPQGRIVHLPQSATPLDFAFAVHTDVGYHCAGARINSRIAPLSSRLKSGDMVEVITSSQRTPSKDWLKFVVTNKARTKIKRWLKQTEQEQMISLGREILSRDLQRVRKDFPNDRELVELAQGMSFVSADTMLASMGNGNLGSQQLIARLHPELRETEHKDSPLKKIIDRVRGAKGIRVQGVGSLMFRFAGCCQPVPGDDIVGFITRGRGVTIHRLLCSNAADLNRQPERVVEVSWDVAKGQTFPVKIEVALSDRKNILRDITEAIGDSDAYLRGAEINANGGSTVGHFAVDITTLAHLERLFQKLRRVPGVLAVSRARLSDSA